MTYSFNQTYSAIDPALLDEIFPTGTIAAVEAIIDDVTTINPSATEKDILQALVTDAFGGTPTIAITDVYR